MATATTKKSPRKTTRKSTARKPAAKRTAARQPVAETVAAPQSVASVVDDWTSRVETAMKDGAQFMRDAAYTYVGIGLVVQDRMVHRGLHDTVGYASFLEEAKAKGHVRVTEIQERFEPIVKSVTDRIEPITDRIEANLPAPVKEALDSGRERVRSVLAA
jgi:hypothetical protein